MKGILSHETLMQIALNELKASPVGVRPNPRVGAALCSLNGEFVSSHHKVFGGPHAEIEVFRECQRRGISTRGGTLAVTLEPCSHFGKTPPCADAIIEAGVSRVIVGVEDPHPKVSGDGIRRLREAGIEVEVGAGAQEIEALMNDWLFLYRNNRPFVRLKMATSIDGLWASENGQSQWITSNDARAAGHVLRANSAALLTGLGTVVADNPSLTARDINTNYLFENQPIPFVAFNRDQGQIDRLSPECKIFSHPKKPEFVFLGQEPLAKMPFGLGDQIFKSFLGDLAARGIESLLVEAGPKLSTWVLERGGLWDEIHHFVGIQILGGQNHKGSFAKPFNCGNLPGLELKLKSLKPLSSVDPTSGFCAIYSPKQA